jgi:hypothetical protein
LWRCGERCRLAPGRSVAALEEDRNEGSPMPSLTPGSGSVKGVSNKRVDEFYDIVSAEANLVIGTAPGENVTDRSAMRFGFEAEGITIRSREAHRYEEGSLGWVVDQPRFGFPDGSGMDCRVTAILRNENGTWRLVRAHFSVGVPDDEVATLQERWSRA